MWLPYTILLIIVHFLALPLHIIFLLLLLLYKLFVILLAKICQDFVGPVPGPSCLFLADKLREKPHSSIIVAFELEGYETKADIINWFQQGYDLRDKKGARCYREFGYCLVHYFGYGFWKQVPNFQLADRIHVLKFDPESMDHHDGNRVSSSTHVYDDLLISVVEKIQRQPYEKGNPLWDSYVLPNYNGKPNRAIMLVRFHHLMSDGMSFIKMFYAVSGGSGNLPANFTKPGTSMKTWDRIAHSVLVKIGSALHLWFIGFIDYMNDIIWEQDKHALHFNEDGELKLTGNWMSFLGTKFELEEVKRASKYFDCTIVHVILAGISNGIERYFVKYHGKDPFPQGFHFVFPLPIPGHPNMRFVNHWCLCKLYSRMGIEQTHEKLKHLKEETKKSAAASLPLMSAFTFQYLMSILPGPLCDLASKARATSTVVLSNVVGPPDTNKWLGGPKVLDIFFWMPVAQESMALSAGVISCNGGVRISLCADMGCIPDRKQLNDLGMMIYEEISEICKMAKKGM